MFFFGDNFFQHLAYYAAYVMLIGTILFWYCVMEIRKDFWTDLTWLKQGWTLGGIECSIFGIRSAKNAELVLEQNYSQTLISVHSISTWFNQTL